MATPRLFVFAARLLTEEARGWSVDPDSRRKRRVELIKAIAQEPFVWLQALWAVSLWAMVGGSQHTIEVLQMQAVWLQALLAAGAWAAGRGEPQGGAHGQPDAGRPGEGALESMQLYQQARFGGPAASGGADPRPASGSRFWSLAGGGQASSRWLTASVMKRGEALRFAALLAGASPHSWWAPAFAWTPNLAKLPQAGSGAQLLALLDAAAKSGQREETVVDIVPSSWHSRVSERLSRARAPLSRAGELLRGWLLEPTPAEIATQRAPLRRRASSEDALSILPFGRTSGTAAAGPDCQAEVTKHSQLQIAAAELTALTSTTSVGEICPISGLFWLLMCAGVVSQL